VPRWDGSIRAPSHPFTERDRFLANSCGTHGHRTTGAHAATRLLLTIFSRAWTILVRVERMALSYSVPSRRSSSSATRSASPNLSTTR
jgi:hypothetical protein